MIIRREDSLYTEVILTLSPVIVKVFSIIGYRGIYYEFMLLYLMSAIS